MVLTGVSEKGGSSNSWSTNKGGKEVFYHHGGTSTANIQAAGKPTAGK